jgi:tRNA (cmo5U34)-methyltransferase
MNLKAYMEAIDMNNKREDVIIKFDEISQVYDEQRKKLIPCFDDFYAIAVSLAELKTDTPRILDLGAGTGLMSSFLLKRYPNALITLIDISEGMLNVAKLRFKDNPNVTFIAADYTKYDYTNRYDLVISSLSIHHLEDQEKKQLYQKIFSIMHNKSLFINADQILGSTQQLDALYKSDWRSKIELSGLNADELSAAYERTNLDKMATLDQQLTWLKEIGFTDVDCVYKYYNFVIMFAQIL